MTTHESQPAATVHAPGHGGVCRDRPAVIIWRLSTDPDGGDAGDSPLTPRLARHLIAIYTDVHDTVIETGTDFHLRQAAGDSARRYLSVCDPTTASTPPDRYPPATLIMLRWPRPAATDLHRATRILQACRKRLAGAGSTVVVTVHGHRHQQQILTAAEAAGLRHRHDIAVLQSEDNRDAFTYETSATANADTPGAPGQPATATLVVLEALA